MATEQECHAALEKLAASMGNADPEHRDVSLERSLSCHVTDLGTVFSGELREGRLDGITTDPRPKAQIRLSMTSDDLVALTEGRLDMTRAWSSGRVKVQASIRDLLKLRSIF